MVFVGIITDIESENNIKQLLNNNNIFSDNNVIFINEKNIDNIYIYCLYVSLFQSIF